MPRFWYTTDGADGPPKYLEADDLPQALLLLKRRGVEVTSAGSLEPPFPRSRGPSEQLLIAFYGQLSSLLAQGLELSVALRRLAAEAANRRLARCASLLADRVAEGCSLSEAMAEQPHIFAAVAVNAVAAAEASGDLAGALDSLAAHGRELQQIGQDVALPLAYPAFLLVVMACLYVMLGTFIWPKFIKLFRDLGMTDSDFPFLTRIAIGVVDFLTHSALPLVILVLGALLFYALWRRARRARFIIRPLGMPVPLFGRLGMYAALARVAASLRVLLAHGVDLGRALRLAGDAAGSRHVSFAMRRAEDVVNQGGSLGEGLRETGLLPDVFVFSLASAESGGDLLAVLAQVEADYLRRIGMLSRTWVVMAGPVIVVALGFLVALAGLSMFLPLISIISNLSR